MSGLHSVRRAARRAFTLVELLIAVMISGMVLLAVYFVFISTAEQFYRQEQIVQAQEGMRFAMDYVKNDLRNAGRLAPVNGALISSGLCEAVDDENGDPVNAVRLYEGGNTAQILDLNNLSPDRLRLMVDASGGVEFTTEPATKGSVEIQVNDLSLQRTEDARRIVGTEARFASMFKGGHYLYITTRSGNKFDLVPIEEGNGGNRQVTLTQGICLNCEGGCVVTPVQHVEYRIEGDGTVGGAPEQSPKTDLVRAVVDARDGSDLDGVSLRMAEYAVDFQVWGTYDTRASAGAPPTIAEDPTPADSMGNWPNTQDEATEFNKRPERIRALNILMATRTPREDTAHVLDLEFDDRPGDLTWFEIDQGVPGFARVTTLRGEVETINLNRGL